MKQQQQTVYIYGSSSQFLHSLARLDSVKQKTDCLSGCLTEVLTDVHGGLYTARQQSVFSLMLDKIWTYSFITRLDRALENLKTMLLFSPLLCQVGGDEYANRKPKYTKVRVPSTQHISWAASQRYAAAAAL